MMVRNLEDTMEQIQKLRTSHTFAFAPREETGMMIRNLEYSTMLAKREGEGHVLRHLE
jgi:hypothetical protein